ncbi:nucleotidyltransferase family protein [Fibrobacterota bacterium]
MAPSILDNQPLSTSFRSEEELLLCCARCDIGGEKKDRIRELAQTAIDWEYAVILSQKQGIAPLVYRNLNNICSQYIPAAVKGELRRAFQYNLTRNMVLSRELAGVLGLFAGSAIDAVPLKGPVMAHALYGDLSLRACGDLDLLVREPDLPRAEELLLRKGYGPLQEKDPLPHPYHRSFVKRDSYITLDLHYGFTKNQFCFNFDSAGPWSRLGHTEFEGLQVNWFRPEDLFMYLCVHLDPHCSPYQTVLKWLCDLSEFMAGYPNADWDWVFTQSSSLGRQRFVCLLMKLAGSLLDAPLPAQARIKIKEDPSLQSIHDTFVGELFSQGGKMMHINRLLLLLSYRERLGHKARLLLGYAEPDGNDVGFIALPSPLFILYYVIRPFRLLCKYRLSLFQPFVRWMTRGSSL